nr:hypothetical protein P5648_13235 [Bacillus subtilis]
MVTNEVPDFQPDFNIEASWDYLAQKLKNEAAEREFIEAINGKYDEATGKQVKSSESACRNSKKRKKLGIWN